MKYFRTAMIYNDCDKNGELRILLKLDKYDARYVTYMKEKLYKGYWNKDIGASTIYYNKLLEVIKFLATNKFRILVEETILEIFKSSFLKYKDNIKLLDIYIPNMPSGAYYTIV
jgi:hypothetical protein